MVAIGDAGALWQPETLTNESAAGALRRGKLLGRLVESPEAGVRLAAAKALGGAAPSVAIRLLAVVSRDPVSLVRAAAAASLGEVAGQKRLPPYRAAQILRLLQNLLADRDGAVRSQAAEAVGRASGLPGADNLLRELCCHKDAALRIGAAAALSHLPSREIGGYWESLEALCSDTNPAVRAQIVFTLSALHPSRRETCIERLAQLSQDRAAQVRVAAALALDRLLLRGPPSPQKRAQMARLLLALASDKNARVRAAAAPALGLLGSDGEERLLSLVQESGPRFAAAIGLARRAERAPEKILLFLRALSQATPSTKRAEDSSALEEFASGLGSAEMRLFARAWLEAVRFAPPPAAWAELAAAAAAFPSARISRLAPGLHRFAEYLGVEDLRAFVSLGRKGVPRLPDVNLSVCLAALKSAAGGIDRLISGRDSSGKSPLARPLQPLTDLAEEIGPPEERAISHLLQKLEGWLGALEKPASEPLECRLLSRRCLFGPQITLAWLITNQSHSPLREVTVRISQPVASRPVSIGALEPEESERVETTLPAERLDLRRRKRLSFSGEITWGGGTLPLQGEVEMLYPRTAAKIANPYLPGKPLEADSPIFYGRQKSLEFLARTLGGEDGRVVIVTGQRRNGKTSLVKAFAARYAHLFQCIYVDLQGVLVDSVPLFFYELSCRANQALEQAGVVMERPRLGEERLLNGCYLEEAARLGRRPLVLILDEFDDLEVKVRSGLLPEAIFGQLRHLFQHTRLSFLLSGTHRLEELGKDYWSFLFNLGIYHQVGLLEEEEAVALIREPMARAGLVCDDLAVEELLELTGGHPYLLQLACHRVVEECAAEKSAGVGRQQARAAARRLIQYGETHLRYLWELAGPESQEILLRLSQGAVRTASAEERALAEGLVARDLAQVCSPGKYALKIRLLGEWLKAAGRPQ